MHRLIDLKRVAVMMVASVLLSFATAAISDSTVVEGSKAAGMDKGGCVAPQMDMRRNHMEYLKHQRDEVVHKGDRSSKFALAECVNCHASKDKKGHPVPVNAKDQFCDSCHDYAAVNITCFQCHRKVPEEK
ncbi:MAG: sulfur reduction protein DsrJ [Gammaproteobacteria bacterium]|nr:sulfur reduction protein DsrJ [Gammaproteobacteria bacterium]